MEIFKCSSSDCRWWGAERFLIRGKCPVCDCSVNDPHYYKPYGYT